MQGGDNEGGWRGRSIIIIRYLWVKRGAARFVKSKYGRYTSVCEMIDELGWPPLSQRRQK